MDIDVDRVTYLLKKLPIAQYSLGSFVICNTFGNPIRVRLEDSIVYESLNSPVIYFDR